MDRLQCRASSSDRGFSPRFLLDVEIRIVGLVAAGASNKQVAWQLALTESSVKAYLNRIYRKLGITEKDGNPRVQLSLWARGHSAAIFGDRAA